MPVPVDPKNTDPRDAAWIASLHGDFSSIPTAAPTAAATPPAGQGWDITTPGTWLERQYEQKVVPTAQKYIGGALGQPLEELAHPLSPYSPQTQTPLKTSLGQAMTPGTIPQLGRDIAIGATSIMGAPWYVGLPVLAGGSAGLGYLTGRDPGEEAFTGAEQWAFTRGMNYLGEGTANWLSDVGETRAGKAAMEKFGSLLKNKWPFLPALNTSEDWADTYGRGREVGPDGLHQSEGLRRSQANLNQTVKKLAQRPDVQSQRFRVQVPTPDMPKEEFEKKFPGQSYQSPTVWVAKSFPEFNQTISDQAHYGFDPRTGQPRPGFDAEKWRHLAYDNRDRGIAQMNKNTPTGGVVQGKPAGLGDEFAYSRRAHDASHVLTSIVTPNRRKLFNPVTGIMDQKAMLDALGSKEGVHLGRSLSRDEMKSLEQALKHGQRQEILDVPSEKGGWGAHMHISPHGIVPIIRRIKSGKTYVPASTADLPWWMNLKPWLQESAKAGGAALTQYWNRPEEEFGGPPPPGPTSRAGGGLSSLLGEGTAYAEEPPEQPPKALPAIRDLQHREISPTPAGAARAGEIAKGLVPGKAPVNIQQDLERGRLSSDEVKKLLQRSGSTDPGAQVAGIPLTDLMSAAETGTPLEKAHLVPLIQQRLMQELPKLGNKTTQANLAQRFKSLQRDARIGAPQPVQ